MVAYCPQPTIPRTHITQMHLMKSTVEILRIQYSVLSQRKLGCCVKNINKTYNVQKSHETRGDSLSCFPSSRGMFARPAPEAPGPPWCAAGINLQPRPSVRAGVRRRLQALSFYATAMRPSVVHGEIQRPFGVHDPSLPLGGWHPLWGRTGLWQRGLLRQTGQKCEGKAHTGSCCQHVP